MRIVVFILLLLSAMGVGAETVRIPAGTLVLRGEYFPPQGQTHVLAPAVLLLHGCNGLYDKAGELVPRYERMKDLLQEMGYGVLLLDSYGRRGVRRDCPKSARKGPRVSAGIRANDAQHALSWLNARRELDGNRLGVLGWSHGATAALTLMGRADPGARAAVAFFPQCQSLNSKRDYRVAAPTLLLLGEADRQAPLAACRKLGELTRQDLFHIVSYPGGRHDFDQSKAAAETHGEAQAGEAGQDAYRRTFKWFSRWFDPARGISGIPPRDPISSK
ncbi:dienelactone hydrolase family protein [Chitinilyticum litopenaei]|uniref:dienelactone hydrolase family protein n=1 Tax=Chitinilyticum litopenaei TaxID=1121276 RepID=UPI000407176A|nr:dienelactone hydrolase family protein [Chitinilyticum litopenaei]